MSSLPSLGASQPTFVTINGVAVNAAHTIDALVAQVAELSLALAAERAHSRQLGEVLMMRVADPSPGPDQPADGPTAVDPGQFWVDPGSVAADGAQQAGIARPDAPTQV